MVRGEGLVIGPKGIFEGIEGIADLGPLGFGGASSCSEFLVFDGSRGRDVGAVAVVEADRHADRAHVGHHAVHGGVA